MAWTIAPQPDPRGMNLAEPEGFGTRMGWDSPERGRQSGLYPPESRNGLGWLGRFHRDDGALASGLASSVAAAGIWQFYTPCTVKPGIRRHAGGSRSARRIPPCRDPHSRAGEREHLQKRRFADHDRTALMSPAATASACMMSLIQPRGITRMITRSFITANFGTLTGRGSAFFWHRRPASVRSTTMPKRA